MFFFSSYAYAVNVGEREFVETIHSKGQIPTRLNGWIFFFLVSHTISSSHNGGSGAFPRKIQMSQNPHATSAKKFWNRAPEFC